MFKEVIVFRVTVGNIVCVGEGDCLEIVSCTALIVFSSTEGPIVGNVSICWVGVGRSVAIILWTGDNVSHTQKAFNVKHWVQLLEQELQTMSCTLTEYTALQSRIFLHLH